MPSSGFFAVLRDVTKLAATAADDIASQGVKMTAAADDIAAMAGPAAAKTAGVAGDDLAVGAGQLGGVPANREIPALLRIAKGSAINKLWLGALLLVVDHYFAAVIPFVLFLGALYLAFEGIEGVLDHFHEAHAQDVEQELTEEQKVKGAIRTDLVLSLEMLVIALASTGEASLAHKITVLVLIGILMTVGVYGLIGLIIRLDDMGLGLLKSAQSWKQWVGRKLLHAAPIILRALEPIGVVAMLAVAGGILGHHVGLPHTHWTVVLVMEVLLGAVAGGLLVGGHWSVSRLQKKVTGR